MNWNRGPKGVLFLPGTSELESSSRGTTINSQGETNQSEINQTATNDEAERKIETDGDSDVELNRSYNTTRDLFEKPENIPSSSDTEWEEVENNDEEGEEIIPESEPIIPANGVEITLRQDPSLTNRKRKSREFDWQNYVRLHLNRIRKEQQIDIHKVNLLCHIGRGIFVNQKSTQELTFALLMSIIPHQFLLIKPSRCEIMEILGCTKWYNDNFKLITGDDYHVFDQKLIDGFEKKVFDRQDVYVIGFLGLMRLLGLDCRLIMSFQTVSLKATDLLKPKIERETSTKRKSKSPKITSLKSPQFTSTPNRESDSHTTLGVPNSSNDVAQLETDAGSTRRLRKRKKNNSKIVESESEEEEVYTSNKSRKILNTSNFIADENFDSDFEEVVVTTKPRDTKRKSLNKKIKEEDGISTDVWIEVYLEKLSSWICVDVINNNVNCQSKMESVATKPLKYVLAFDGKGKVKDVTQKYAANWMTFNRKLQVDNTWWEETLGYFRPRLTKREKNENEAIQSELNERPLPTTIGEYKNHPLYALHRHLLKFEAIYPPDSVPVGYIRKEPVYDRQCVHTLHSRETWLKQAKVVKIGETPYKIVKGRPKWNKLLRQMEDAPPLEIFGSWQTEDYVPQTAVNGKVPRNEYGNVDLFQPCMLPIGTVHIQVPRLLKVARKLGVDCVPAMVGWDFNKNGNRPTFDGWVVCAEHKDALMAAWREQMKIDNERITQKREQRIYGNWKKLIRLLVIRERINTKYLKVNKK